MSHSHRYPKRQLQLVAFNNQLEIIEKTVVWASKNPPSSSYGRYNQHNNRYALPNVTATASIQQSHPQVLYGVGNQHQQVQSQYILPNAISPTTASQPSYHPLARTQAAQPMSGSISRQFYSPTGSQFPQAQAQIMQPAPSSNNTNMSQAYDQVSPSPSSLLSDNMSKDFGKFNDSAHSLNSPNTFSYPLEYSNSKANEPLDFKLNLDSANWPDKSSIWNKDSGKTNIW